MGQSMPHGKIIIVFVAILFIAAVLGGLERPGTAIVDHAVVAVLPAFRLTTPIGPGLLRNLTIRAVCGPIPIPRHVGLPRPAL